MSPTQALFWKEWRQMQWRWIFCLVVTMLFLYIGLKTRVLVDEAIIGLAFLGCALPIPLSIAMGLVAEECEEGSIRMQLALPVSARQVYIVKMILSVIAAVAIGAMALLITITMAGNREKTTADILRTVGFCPPLGAVFMLWTVVFSIKRKTQWAVALTGIAIVVAWMFLVFFDNTFTGRAGRDSLSISLAVTPLGLVSNGVCKGQLLVTALVQTIFAAILFWWGMRRFSTLARSGK